MPLYITLQHLLNVLVQVANKVGKLKKESHVTTDGQSSLSVKKCFVAKKVVTWIPNFADVC
jgi:hypothetical protein